MLGNKSGKYSSMTNLLFVYFHPQRIYLIKPCQSCPPLNHSILAYMQSMDEFLRPIRRCWWIYHWFDAFSLYHIEAKIDLCRDSLEFNKWNMTWTFIPKVVCRNWNLAGHSFDYFLHKRLAWSKMKNFGNTLELSKSIIYEPLCQSCSANGIFFQ